MTKNRIEKPISASPEPPEYLFGRIMSRIHKEREEEIIKRRIILLSFVSAASFVSVFPAFQLLKADLAASGFFAFFSLLFSDFAIVAAYWQNFVFSLLESLPITGLAAISISSLAFLWSIKLLTKGIGEISKINLTVNQKYAGNN